MPHHRLGQTRLPGQTAAAPSPLCRELLTVQGAKGQARAPHIAVQARSALRPRAREDTNGALGTETFWLANLRQGQEMSDQATIRDTVLPNGDAT